MAKKKSRDKTQKYWPSEKNARDIPVNLFCFAFGAVHCSNEMLSE